LATKWKSSIKIGVWAFLLTFALSGVLTLFVSWSDYVYKDYFHTPQFQSELNQFTAYLSLTEFDETTVEDAKKSITVSEGEIEDYRIRHQDLTEQIEKIKNQYGLLIQEAGESNNEKAIKSYEKERDAKIYEVTTNLNDDEYVRSKVKQEKEQEVEAYFQKRETYRSDPLYLSGFTYYIKNSDTGKVYTNLKTSEDESAQLNSKNMHYLTNYSIPSEILIDYGLSGDKKQAIPFVHLTPETFEGKIGVAKSAPKSSGIMVEYKNYQQDQLFLLIYSLVSLVVLILCVHLAKKAKAVPADIENWQPFYNKIPIDIRAVLFLIASVLAFIFIMVVGNEVLYVNEDPLTFGGEVILSLFFGTISLALAVVQGKFFAIEFKDLPNVKKQWDKSLIQILWKWLKIGFRTAKQNFMEAFLDQSTGSQVFFLFLAVFLIGAMAVIVMVDPFFALFYMLILAVVGFPLGLQVAKKIGYFNRIVEKTNELAAGKHGEDLQVDGNTVLDVLAGNINLLKQGVKHSESEQAKSERLKTELITNVSHDLRTPLTSIITYTELLKSEEVTEEERTAYLEIIDRKSKRLKVLIEDLFEVSKMASGSIELVKEKVDLNQLLLQSLAEHDDRIKESSLQFRVTKAENPVYTFVDGQKLWRVFDNLIENILKYSIENSRVFISVHAVEDLAIITFKNVSKYELSDNNDELFERFKRGDTSRHTDGSGLGLAIVKSIIDLHEGNFEIKADGDLFKAIISLKLEE
jgi:signal transduction histidine kinase